MSSGVKHKIYCHCPKNVSWSHPSELQSGIFLFLNTFDFWRTLNKQLLLFMITFTQSELVLVQCLFFLRQYAPKRNPSIKEPFCSVHTYEKWIPLFTIYLDLFPCNKYANTLEVNFISSGDKIFFLEFSWPWHSKCFQTQVKTFPSR